ncbi:CAM snf1 amk1 family protein [Cyclospora cayetanensis]|uniref:CAM snf1 amk1 family protein n=1 Tax=Cyclospora cayetanensis TaxID=88456 RepID=A0A1D3D592_9EIME|nr:CAM snf1 amk1 family protein [Cyclospora cayetanensis]
MLGVPDFEVEKLSSSTFGWKRILVALNGEQSEPKQLKLPPQTAFPTFLERSSALHGLAEAAKRAFSDNGEEIFDVEQILDDDLVYISNGSGFVVGNGGATGGGMESRANSVPG